MPRGRQTDRVESHILNEALESFRAFALKTNPAMHTRGKVLDAENTILMLGAKAFSKRSPEHTELHSMLKECARAKPKSKGVDTRVLDCLYTYHESGALELYEITAILQIGLHKYIGKLHKEKQDTTTERRALQEIERAVERANTVTFANASRKGHGHRSRTIAEMKRDNAQLDSQLRSDKERIFRLKAKIQKAPRKQSRTHDIRKAPRKQSRTHDIRKAPRKQSRTHDNISTLAVDGD